MPGAIGGGILTPGAGPNGPGPIDARRPISSVGYGSTVPYGPTNGYATPNGVTGFIGPAVGSLQKPIIFYVRAAGSNTNGGDTTAISPEQSGGDGSITSTTTGTSNTGGTGTFTSASAVFTSAHIGRSIQVASRTYRITGLVSTTSVRVLSGLNSIPQSGTAWAVGGAWADMSGGGFGNSISAIYAGDSIYIGAGTCIPSGLLGGTDPRLQRNPEHHR